ncbi:MAG: hypothetical protein WA690_02605 [Candidatus Acidiferrales bacterium]
MPLNKALFGLGLAIYILSFFLVATGDPEALQTGRIKGYECAYLSLKCPITCTPFSPTSDNYAPPFLYLSILIGGLINPVFLSYTTLAILKRNSRAAHVLKFVLISMIPFCWVVFYSFEIYPREGHALWVIGMLLVLFASWKQVPKQVA